MDAQLAADAKKFLGQFANMVKLIQKFADAQPDLAEIDALGAKKATLIADVAKVEEDLRNLSLAEDAALAELSKSRDDINQANAEADFIRATAKRDAAEIAAKAFDAAQAAKAQLALDLEAAQKAADAKLKATNIELVAVQTDLSTLRDELNRLRAKFNG